MPRNTQSQAQIVTINLDDLRRAYGQSAEIVYILVHADYMEPDYNLAICAITGKSVGVLTNPRATVHELRSATQRAMREES